MKKLLRSVSPFLLAASVLVSPGIAASGAVPATPFWISPCSDPATGCKPGDLDLARWALASWQAASQGKLRFEETKDRSRALIRLVWASPTEGLYGETVPIEVNGRHGSQIYIVDTTQNVTDSLLRDTIVYLTCLHESGHALGLSHTDRFDDIMYYFGFGGDVAEYFGRYRRKLSTRADIRENSGLSAEDIARLREQLKGAQ